MGMVNGLQPMASTAGECPGHLHAPKSDLECLQGSCQQKRCLSMQEFRNKTPHLFIKETHSRPKDSLEWKEVLCNKYNWTSEEHLTQCHAGNCPLCLDGT